MHILNNTPAISLGELQLECLRTSFPCSQQFPLCFPRGCQATHQGFNVMKHPILEYRMLTQLIIFRYSAVICAILTFLNICLAQYWQSTERLYLCSSSNLRCFIYTVTERSHVAAHMCLTLQLASGPVAARLTITCTTGLLVHILHMCPCKTHHSTCSLMYGIQRQIT